MMTSPPAAAEPAARNTIADVSAMRRVLWRTYLGSLERYASRTGGILARSLVRDGLTWTATEPSPLNTAEVVKAALLLDARGIPHALDGQALLEQLVTNHTGDGDCQTISLALWAAATGHEEHAAALWRRLRDCLAADMSQSMTLAWALSALCQYLPMSRQSQDVTDLANRLAARLLANQDAGSDLFYASARRQGWLRRRKPDTTLSSQTYPIAALVAYATAFGRDDAIARAQRCADRLCQMQGPLGQWWWRYDSRRGTPLARYPVFSVNQDGAVPMALGSLQLALGDGRYNAAIERGLAWQFGENEMTLSLVNEEAGIVGRSIDSVNGGFTASWEMYAYQPARFLYAVLSHPQWATEIAA